jgi:hypothetical protein
MALPGSILWGVQRWLRGRVRKLVMGCDGRAWVLGKPRTRAGLFGGARCIAVDATDAVLAVRRCELAGVSWAAIDSCRRMELGGAGEAQLVRPWLLLRR